MKRWVLLSVWFMFLIAIPSAWAVGLIIVEDTHWWPGPNPPGPIPPYPPPWPPRPYPPPHRPHIFAPLEVREVKVKTSIHDQIAVTSVDQEFYNPNSARLEGTFVFPVPKGAHLDKFTMEIDGKSVDAELLAADKARRIYEDIVRKLKDPALLEYAGRDVFKVRIFPIEPNSHKRIRVSYTQLLNSDNGLISYLLPLTAEKYSAKPVKTVSVKIDLETKRALKSIYSPSHQVEIKREGTNRAVAGYEASDVQPDADLALYFAPEKGDLGINLLTHRTRGDEGYFLLLASAGVEAKESRVMPKDVAFVLDTSGSMAGAKLEQAKKALLFCVENLNAGDRFEIIRFSTESEPLFDGLVEASKPNRAKAENFIQELKPIGGTAIDDALQRALRLRTRAEQGTANTEADGPSASSALQSNARPFAVIFLTDGRPTIGTTDEDQIVAHANKASAGRTRIFCFGIGTDVNTHLLDRITEETRAVSQYVLPEEDLEVKVSTFFAKIKDPVLANPTLKFTGDIHPSRLYPSPLPDLFSGQQLVLVGRYSGHGDTALILEGSVNGAARKFTFEEKFPEESVDREFVPRLWATRRVGYLLDEIRLHGENAELREEATELARKYGIVTPYTAYLILEDETRRGVPAQLRSLETLERDQGARQEAARSWHQFTTERAGDSAVADAQLSLALKAADAAAPAANGSSQMFMRRYGLVPGASSSPNAAPAAGLEGGRLLQHAQQANFVGGKNFFQNDKQWIDSAVQKNANAKRVRIQFASPEYFEFAAKNTQTLPWLALGQNVQFVYNNAIYEIYE